MSVNLIIRLKNPLTESSLEWVVWDESNQIPLASGTLTNLAANLANPINKIIVLVPGEDVFVTQIQMPRLSATKLAKALPFALEDELTEDSSQLHYVVGEREKDKKLTVAVVNKKKMADWREFLKLHLQADYPKISAFFVDFLSLPWEKNHIVIGIDNGEALVKLGNNTGFCIEKNALLPILMLEIKQQGVLKSSLIHIYTEDKTELFSEAEIKNLGIPIQVSLASKPFVITLAPQASHLYSLNLLQDIYHAPLKKIFFEKLVWISLIIAGAWLSIATIVGITNYFIYSREEKILNDKLAEIYHSIVPNKPYPQNPKAEVQKILTDLRHRNQGSSYLGLLNTVALIFNEIGERNVKLNSLVYKNKQLEFDVEARDFKLLDSLGKRLETQGIKVVMSNAIRSPDGLVKVHFVMEEIS